jgi:hypothetical protein
MRSTLTYIVLSLILLSCDEPFVLDIAQTPPKVVIEALVTDRPEYQSVRVSRSAGFYDSGETPRVTDATVLVTDDAGGEFPFVHNPLGSADSAGIYVPAVPFAGVVGRRYFLKVVADNISYEASDVLSTVIPLDSLSYEKDEDEVEDPEFEGRYYEVRLFAKEPQDEDNYYLFQFYRNDSLTFANDTDIYYSDDALLAENIDGIPTPIYYSLGDTAVVQAFSISRPAYIYFNDLFSLLNGDSGGMFGPVPSSPRTNLSNGALGFFQVSSVVSKGIRLQ